MTDLKQWVEKKWKCKSFPQNVTLQVFRQIRSDKTLFKKYQKAIANSERQPDDQKQAQVNRRIGKMVKRVLKAKVIGRSLPLNRKEELIETHALLEPDGP
jgi:hypothetical protein